MATTPPANKSAEEKPHSFPAKKFRARFDELERERSALVARLNAMSDKAAAHPASRRAMTLLNATFRKATIAQRLAVLQAAAWLIDVLEKLTNLG